MKNIKNEIHNCEDLVCDILERSSISRHDELSISDQAIIRYDGSYLGPPVEYFQIAYFTLNFGIGVSAGMIAN